MKFDLAEDGSARSLLRHRRRSRLDPDRRSTHAADHLRCPIEDKSDLYNQIDTIIPQLADEDFELDEKQRSVVLTEAGNEKIEQVLEEAGLLQEGSLYDVETSPWSTTSTRRWRPQAVPARQGLHRQGRRGHHHRRVHRPHDAGPALLRRPAPGA
jgi:hypothetical protein